MVWMAILFKYILFTFMFIFWFFPLYHIARICLLPFLRFAIYDHISGPLQNGGGRSPRESTASFSYNWMSLALNVHLMEMLWCQTLDDELRRSNFVTQGDKCHHHARNQGSQTMLNQGDLNNHVIDMESWQQRGY